MVGPGWRLDRSGVPCGSCIVGVGVRKPCQVVGALRLPCGLAGSVDVQKVGVVVCKRAPELGGVCDIGSRSRLVEHSIIILRSCRANDPSPVAVYVRSGLPLTQFISRVDPNEAVLMILQPHVYICSRQLLVR